VQTLRMSVPSCCAWADSQPVTSLSHAALGSGPGIRMMSSLPGWTSGDEMWWVMRREAEAVKLRGVDGGRVPISEEGLVNQIKLGIKRRRGGEG